ncbi:MAG: hypothetical protein IANPNBLG_05005 [Bryobacteraceae bacterium]|nr:hypothetical protein [Bryobacteraceae bacterium]MCC6341402.1 hypothetical protein [Bryobacterales bacterium]
MRSIKERLEQSVATLGTLERKREEMRSPALGADTEWSLIESELREIEEDILQDPGALEKFLVRDKRSA